jgi:hypothetical protein
MNIRSEIIIGLSLVVLITLLLPNCTPMVDVFPIGLTLEYHITYGAYEEWDEKFVIRRWAPEYGNDFLLVNFYSNRAGTLNATMYLEIKTWTTLFENGSQTNSQLQPPLWVNTQSWHDQVTIHIPTFPGEYYISSEYVQLNSGTYSCWQANSIGWISLDDDYSLTEETWYFQKTHGVLLKYTSKLKASQQIIYSYTFLRELIAHNMHIHGILTEEQTRSIDGIIVTLFLTIFIPSIGITKLMLIQNKRKRRD